MATVRDLITEALELIGVVAAGETPAAADVQTTLNTLNFMIDSWANDRLALFDLPREVFELTPGKSIYSFGVGGDFDSIRPMEILGAAYGPLIKTPIYGEVVPPVDDPLTPDDESLVIPDPVIIGYDLRVNQEFPVKVLGYQHWMAIFDKTTSSEFVASLYPFGSAPIENVQVYPVPSIQLGLVVYSKKIITEFEDANVVVTLPPGYKQAIIDNLAVKISKKFGKPTDPELINAADKSKASIKRQNVKVPLMNSDAATASTNSWRKNSIYGGMS